ncbi:putative cation/H+ exchanger, rossmann-like alpha/beta/alpha sandwich [Rosa chinensis]|uniref:Putative cation/H+ exchanger, rossmann-like alpha/beta/alpha sandwich n=1 Tax=Rosa chinensis TaxID=74649 RepID=A0A2P6REJ8_ROSCH|nr:cation/H(+) antiporter 19 [Rosa chinensis]PRQ44859.1 putative cation/H+ exchanger, rossmann-like alpha/beta/alpha sandwich [Rosa chinensis]
MAPAPLPATTPPMKATSNGSFQGENPLDYALPLLILQIILVVVFTRFLAYLLKPLRQPRVIAEVIGGCLLGPSAFGRSKTFLHMIFPPKGMTVLDTVANIGLCFFLFLVGLELDIGAIRRTGKKSLGIAFCGITLPFVLGIGTSEALRATVSKGVKQGPFLVFNGVALSITAFPVLARILAELKLLTTDVGRIAMSAAAVNDVAAWILLALAIALTGNNTSPLVSVWVLLCGAGFVGFAVVAIRPILVMMARRSPEGEPVKELYICITLSLVLAAGFVTDTIGIHALFGAFVVGIIMPKEGPFAGVLIEKIEDLVSGLLLPLYFVSSGLKTNFLTISGGVSWGMLVLVICTASFGKIVGTVTVSMLFKVPFREALALGFLMNTKGLVELIVLNIGKDRKVLNEQTFAIFVLMALFTTFITTPLVMAVYKPARKGAPYKLRTIFRKSPDTELRILACFHTTRNIPTIINLIESSRGTHKRGRLTIYAMHLMELSERSSAISMVHKARYNGLPFWNKKSDGNDQMVIAFEAYEQLSSVKIRPATAISSLNDMHEDICACAHQKTVAMILLPFHKHQKLDGTMESVGHSFQVVNERVLRHAPCSVGILVDRGLGGTTQVSASEVSFTAVVAFFGGRDDREALAYGMRLAEHPGIALTVFRFVAPQGKTLRFGAKLVGITADNKKILKEEDSSQENEEDEKFLEEYKNVRSSNKEKEESMFYEEKVVDSKGEIAVALKTLSKHNLFIVGRMSSTVPLVESSDCAELGPIGSFLASSDFSSTASVVVIQQYDATASRPLVVEEADYELPESSSMV